MAAEELVTGASSNGESSEARLQRLRTQWADEAAGMSAGDQFSADPFLDPFVDADLPVDAELREEMTEMMRTFDFVTASDETVQQVGPSVAPVPLHGAFFSRRRCRDA